MKIFYDFYEIAFDRGKSVGIYNYALGLLNALASNNPDADFIVACSETYSSDFPQHANIQLRIISEEYPTITQRFRWRYSRAMKMARNERADIYFSPKGFSPGISKRKTRPFVVVTIHDMIPFYYREKSPGYFGFLHNFIITKMMLRTIEIANSIITVSNFSKKEIRDYSHKDRDINVVYNGVSMAKSPAKPGNIPYIFAITSNFPHKNKINVINGYLAYTRKVKDPLPLKICGIDEADAGISLDANTDITFIKYAEGSYLIELYANASAFLFMTAIEGFGFPPLEALLYNVPSVVSDIAVFREILPGSAVFADPYDTEQIGSGLKTLLEDNVLYSSILDNSRHILDKYTWEKCSLNTIDIFKKVVQEV